MRLSFNWFESDSSRGAAVCVPGASQQMTRLSAANQRIRFMSCVFFFFFDGVLKEHIENATVFKGTSKTVQNELLDCMLSVVREHIITEAQSSDFIAIQADETMDISTQCQLVLVLRYIDGKNTVQERFFEFIPLTSATAESIAAALGERLAAILPEVKIHVQIGIIYIYTHIHIL